MENNYCSLYFLPQYDTDSENRSRDPIHAQSVYIIFSRLIFIYDKQQE